MVACASIHGIDIFAPRGTPVLAAARGYVTRVNETPRGGRVVWVRDETRSLSLYYAHLDKQLVENGSFVEIGDTLGLVGNTGNARTTPPHLHFGVYRRGEGPLDPRPWVALGNTTPARVSADTSMLGSWARTARATSLRAAPNGAVLRSVEAETMLQLLSARTEWYRVRLPDGSGGHVRAADIASAATPLRTFSIEGETILASEPRGVRRGNRHGERGYNSGFRPVQWSAVRPGRFDHGLDPPVILQCRGH